jgi:hypothetical protein
MREGERGEKRPTKEVGRFSPKPKHTKKIKRDPILAL